MPTIQEGNFVNSIRSPGYWGFFSGDRHRRSGTGIDDLHRKSLRAARSSNAALNRDTTFYKPLEHLSNQHRFDERNARIFDRNAGRPRYNTFNCVDRDEAGPVTKSDDEDKLHMITKRASLNIKEPVRGPSYFPEAISTRDMFSRPNIDPWRSRVLPFPTENELAKSVYKTWEDMKPIFSRTDGMVRHNHWGVQDDVGWLDYIRSRESYKGLYADAEAYRRSVEDRRKTARAVISLSGVDYANPRSERYAPLVRKPDVNPVQQQLSHLNYSKKYDMRPFMAAY